MQCIIQRRTKGKKRLLDEFTKTTKEWEIRGTAAAASPFSSGNRFAH